MQSRLSAAATLAAAVGVLTLSGNAVAAASPAHPVAADTALVGGSVGAGAIVLGVAGLLVGLLRLHRRETRTARADAAASEAPTQELPLPRCATQPPASRTQPLPRRVTSDS